ncbi:apolipo protein O-domain-containing protein [Polychytrium aggregatum]|uniref:apolipo protein O-domain-containing protein n=1 Tax=Polychytrium aggregatum TaxID=110093 RepID=UPI0022FF20DF|nr:apolipo protein O-domain-containing protein [Polychytrium aggregatum]KAI9204849.1 apolipo protein O-domain-containing protein [Polychytrium aggregatum]
MASSAARLASRSVAIPVSALLVGSASLYALYPSAGIYAESSATSAPADSPSSASFVPAKKVLSIYDEPEARYEIVDEPTSIELSIREARFFVTDQFKTSRAAIQTGVDEWIQVERSVRNNLATFVHPDEKFLPGALYVTISTFAGSIIANKRSLGVRIAAPLALAAGSFVYWYPLTTRNIFAKGGIQLPNISLSKTTEQFSQSLSNAYEWLGIGKDK